LQIQPAVASHHLDRPTNWHGHREPEDLPTGQTPHLRRTELGPDICKTGAVLPHRDIDLSFDDLPGLSYLAPGARTRLDIEVAAGRSFSLPVMGLVPLTRLDSVLRKLLLQGNADSRVAISLHNASGRTGRINLRRYHGQMSLRGDMLTLGLDADLPRGATFAPVQGPGHAQLHLTQIETGEVQELAVTLGQDALNLRVATGFDSGLWLVQGRFNGQHQRPAAWLAAAPDAAKPSAGTTRPSRIRNYRARLIDKGKAGGMDRDWTHLLHLLLAARDGGDPAMLDQFHALAEAPPALARMMFVLPAAELNMLFTLDSYWNLFWPALPVADLAAVARDMVEAIGNSLILAGITLSKAIPTARGAVLARLALLRSLRPDMAGHLAVILIETRLLEDVATDRRFDGLLIAQPKQALDEAVQTIARSDPELPGGIEGVMPIILPMPQRGFQRPVAMTVGTVLSVAEHVLGLRSPLTAAQMLDATLIESAAPDLFGRALHRALLAAYSNQRT